MGGPTSAQVPWLAASGANKRSSAMAGCIWSPQALKCYGWLHLGPTSAQVLWLATFGARKRSSAMTGCIWGPQTLKRYGWLISNSSKNMKLNIGERFVFSKEETKTL